jgi:nitrite reductase/ring-hydroxylating ferredoxin subunit
VAPEDVERTCSTHLLEFDCPTGARLNPATCRLLSYPYPVRVETGTIQVGF